MHKMNLKLLPMLLLGAVLAIFSACNNDSIADLPTPDNREIWTGATLSFEKTAGTSAQDASNQDRITDKVWITRANDGGEIYNAQSENGLEA